MLSLPQIRSFVPRRHSSNYIIIVQEVMHSMHIEKSDKGYVDVKVDLEKAYDGLDWTFLRDTLTSIELADSFTNVIMSVSSSRL